MVRHWKTGPGLPVLCGAEGEGTKVLRALICKECQRIWMFGWTATQWLGLSRQTRQQLAGVSLERDGRSVKDIPDSELLVMALTHHELPRGKRYWIRDW